jgi:putative DNA methylase
VLADDGRKRYARPDDGDLQAFQEAARVLESEVSEGRIRLPVAVLEPGHNTRQAMAYNFLTWRSFFNERQLLALGWLQKAIAILPDERVRAALLLVFSGALEFNNMFASYKGEGTGAVRHMFSHHVLKPERMPIEANVWGTHKSSGSFSGLYRARLLRALDYAEAPSEVGGRVGTKARVCSPPFSGRVDLAWPSAGALERRGIYLSCASSDSLDLPDRSADYVVTDPPFFDNVHYSELADFFFAWQSLYPRGFIQRGPSTRDVREVQDADPGAFAAKLQSVFAECRRVLKDDGLLVFSYHHSRAEGWTTLAGAVAVAGFSFVSAHPVRSEMTVAAPKSQAKEPIQLDVLFACRKRDRDRRRPAPPETALHLAEQRSVEKVALLRSAGLSLSPGDLRVVLLSQFLVALCPRDAHEIVSALMAFLPDLDAVIARVAECPREAAARSPSPDGQALLPLDTHGSHRSRAGKGAEGRAGTGKRAARFGS